MSRKYGSDAAAPELFANEAFNFGREAEIGCLQAIDGPLFITSCVTVRGECGQSDRCNIREPLRKVNESIEAVLKRIKVSHMREEPEEVGSAVPKTKELVTIT